MRQVIWKKIMSSGAPNGICRISQTGGKQPIRAELEPCRLSEQLSITRELRSKGQTRQGQTQIWFIFDQRCLAWPFDRSSWVIDSCLRWMNRNALSLKLPLIGESLPSRARFFKAWKQSHGELQKSSFSQNTWITICWKVIMDFFSKWCQKHSAYCRFELPCFSLTYYTQHH